MKKLIIGALVTGLILFIWQFLSYGLMDLHYSQMAYTPAQEEIMKTIEAQNLEDGEYYMIRAPKENPDLQNQLMEERLGKPWAQVQYHSSLEHNFGMNMFRALIINILIGLILCWILMNFASLNMKTSVLTCLGIGIIGYLVINYLDSIWFQTNSLPDLIDAIVPWTVIGIWLGWWLNK